MSYDAFNAPLGIFNMLTGAHNANVEIVKQASAADNLPSLNPPPHTKEASIQPSREESILVGLEKSAAIYNVASEQFLKQAAEASGQPASPNGPADNESATTGSATFTPPEASTNQTGNKGMETDGDGPNHIKTDEDNTENLSTSGGSALGKQAEVAALRAYLKKVAAGEHTTIGSSGTAAGQPGSPVGPSDNESATPSNSTKGNHMVTGSPSSVALTTAQEAELHAKNQEFPINEPQGNKSNVQSGSGVGPGSPDPHKTASIGDAAAAKNYLLGMVKQSAADGDCKKCKEATADCKCPPFKKDEGDKKPDSKEDEDDKKPEDGQEKESMMGQSNPAAMGDSPAPAL